jgi:hypothetical protein
MQNGGEAEQTKRRRSTSYPLEFKRRLPSLVPEPAMSALLAGGLALFGARHLFQLRRRASKHC